MQSMHVLLTCAGRRNLLVRSFQEALQGRGRVLVADASPTAPAMQVGDEAFVVPPIADPTYVDQLADICQRKHVRLLLSLNDLELPLLAAQRTRFQTAGTLVAVSPPDVINVCFDKWAMGAFLQSHGIATPRTYRTLPEAQAALAAGTLHFPLLLKPRWGTASMGVTSVYDADELTWAFELAQRQIRRSSLGNVAPNEAAYAVLIQERLTGEEYGLDVVNDLAGQHQATFIKRKLADSMSSEGVLRAETVAHARLQELGAQLGRCIGHIANMDCDVFVDDERCVVIDLNPRFGGGYSFSHVAGANLPAALLAWAAGEQPDPAWLRVAPGVTSAKYDDIVRVHEKQ